MSEGPRCCPCIHTAPPTTRTAVTTRIDREGVMGCPFLAGSAAGNVVAQEAREAALRSVHVRPKPVKRPEKTRMTTIQFRGSASGSRGDCCRFLSISIDLPGFQVYTRATGQGCSCSSEPTRSGAVRTWRRRGGHGDARPSSPRFPLEPTRFAASRHHGREASAVVSVSPALPWRRLSHCPR